MSTVPDHPDAFFVVSSRIAKVTLELSWSWSWSRGCEYADLRGFGLPPRCKLGLCSSGTLRTGG